jgi:hypothetical protein
VSGVLSKMLRLSALLLLAESAAPAGVFHVSPSGAPSGNGSSLAPWDLATALHQPPAVQPGDTIWLHRGIYYGSFISNLNGTAAHPILLRPFPGEGAAIDGGNSQQDPILLVRGSYVWYWGFEIYSSDPVRSIADSGSSPPVSSLPRGLCLTTEQSYPTYGNKFINMILHDGFGGFSAWMPANTELYGSVIYNNGWDAPDRPHGHGIYIQNQAGDERRSIANIVWGSFENNIQAYGTQYIDDFYFEKNIIFKHQGDGRDLLIGGGNGPAHRARVLSNYTYEPSSVRNVDLGWEPYGKGIDSALVTGNFFLGGEMYMQGPITNTVVSQNVFYSLYNVGFSGADSLLNTFLDTPPADTVIVIPNAYEPGRANVAVYNWSLKPFVSLDVSGVLSPGDFFEVSDAQNYFGPPAASGIYGGGSIVVPMTGLVAVSPIGKPGSRVHTAPRFAAFVVLRGGGPSVSDVGSEKELPQGIALLPNYPNPFNPSTTIRYTLASAGEVRLRVFTLLGQEAATLVTGRQAAGEHTVVFDAKGLSSGVYVYELRVGAERRVRTMMLLR